MHLSAAELVLVLAATAVGALVQGGIGFGMNLVVVPVVALVEPEALPTTPILLAIPLVIGMLWREHPHVDRYGVGWVMVGRLPGTAFGTWLVAVLATDTLSALVGGLVVLAAAMSALSPPVPITPGSATAVGFASGTMGTASSIGGPPVALLYQHHPGPTVRATLATTFALGTVISLAALGLAGEVHRWQIGLALALTPAIVVGVLVSRAFHDRLDAGRLRPAVLVFATLTGAIALLRGLW